jgi:hypothetical protein
MGDVTTLNSITKLHESSLKFCHLVGSV